MEKIEKEGRRRGNGEIEQGGQKRRNKKGRRETKGVRQHGWRKVEQAEESKINVEGQKPKYVRNKGGEGECGGEKMKGGRQHKDGGKDPCPPVCVTTDSQGKEGSTPLLLAALQT